MLVSSFGVQQLRDGGGSNLEGEKKQEGNKAN